MSLEIHDTEDGHYYEYDGTRVLGVSEILESADVLIKNSYYEERKEYAALRGRDVHMACADLDRGYPAWWEEDEVIAPYVKAWALFKADFSFKPHTVEIPAYHADYHYAGTPDRSGELLARGSPRLVVPDIKCVATIGKHVDLQLAGYRMLFEDYMDRDAIAVQLKPTGKYKVYVPQNPEQDRHVFLACLTLTRWKARFIDGKTR